MIKHCTIISEGVAELMIASIANINTRANKVDLLYHRRSTLRYLTISDHPHLAIFGFRL